MKGGSVTSKEISSHPEIFKMYLCLEAVCRDEILSGVVALAPWGRALALADAPRGHLGRSPFTYASLVPTAAPASEAPSPRSAGGATSANFPKLSAGAQIPLQDGVSSKTLFY